MGVVTSTTTVVNNGNSGKYKVVTALDSTAKVCNS